MNKHVNEALRRSVYLLLAHNPEIVVRSAGVDRWHIECAEIGLAYSFPLGADDDYLWQDLFTDVSAIVAAYQAYRAAEAEVQRMKAQTDVSA